jgi:hypothetical protein
MIRAFCSNWLTGLKKLIKHGSDETLRGRQKSISQGLKPDFVEALDAKAEALAYLRSKTD